MTFAGPDILPEYFLFLLSYLTHLEMTKAAMADNADLEPDVLVRDKEVEETKVPKETPKGTLKPVRVGTWAPQGLTTQSMELNPDTPHGAQTMPTGSLRCHMCGNLELCQLEVRQSAGTTNKARCSRKVCILSCTKGAE